MGDVRQLPLMRALNGDGDPHAVARGRLEAARAVAAGYAAAVRALDASDAEELDWHLERLRDAELGVRNASAEHLLPASSWPPQ